MNLTHYLFEEAKDLPEGLASVLADIAAACKSISHDVDRSGLLGLHGDIGAENVQGEQQQILDDKSNTILKDTLAENEYVLAIASEEEDTVVDCADGTTKGYGVAYDPLDGSSNIDINASTGTIFSVLPASSADDAVFLQGSESQVAAGYVLYGSSTVMVFSAKDGVHEFTLDPDSGEFIQTEANIQIPQNAGYISYNSYVLPKMPSDKAKAFEKLILDTGRSQRWMGAMVADIHRTLVKGGFFAYPETGNDGNYIGKLRMQYEAKPLGWLVEQAGGKAYVNNVPLADYTPHELHERVSVEIGDAETIDLYLSYLQK